MVLEQNKHLLCFSDIIHCFDCESYEIICFLKIDNISAVQSDAEEELSCTLYSLVMLSLIQQILDICGKTGIHGRVSPLVLVPAASDNYRTHLSGIKIAEHHPKLATYLVYLLRCFFISCLVEH